jgi:ribosomal protein S18 acetylase RimI-like enzyme
VHAGVKDVTIRRGTPLDHPSFRFVMEWHGGVEPPAGFLQEVAAAANSFAVEMDGDCVGQVIYKLRPNSDGGSYVSLLFMHLDPTIRGRGIGSRLIELVEGEGVAAGAALCALTVDALNVRARALYERRGYAPYHEQQSVYEVVSPDGVKRTITADETCMYRYLSAGD